MIPGSHFDWFPLSNPGIVSIPRSDPEIQAEMEVRSLTGVGAEKATHH